MEIPFYLFTGFLDAGKTRLIQETLSDKSFNTGGKTLILLCEEGENEYDLSAFPEGSVAVEVLTRVEQVNPDKLSALVRKHAPSRVMVEYNGMWMLDALYNALPDRCMVYQELFLADATTFPVYNANMRSLVVDKLQSCEIVVFNRFDFEKDKMELHKIVRGVSRKCNIVYENGDTIEYDDIEDPLPFDLNAPVVEIKNEDYAFFYRDLAEELPKYDGKTVVFTGLVARDPQLGDRGMVIGRHVMTCCEADITYKGLAAVASFPIPAMHGSWQTVKGTIRIEKHKIYKSKGPVLYVESLKPAMKPEKDVATFY